jgi:hypothetical protein
MLARAQETRPQRARLNRACVLPGILRSSSLRFAHKERVTRSSTIFFGFLQSHEQTDEFTLNYR